MFSRRKQNRKKRNVYNLGEENGEEYENLSLIVFGINSVLESFQWNDQNSNPA